jgi:transcriptional regulator NrdR family protein
MDEIKISVFSQLLGSKDVPYETTINKVVERIRKGKIKNAIDQIRNTKDDKNKSYLKRQLNCIIFSGIFKERNSHSLIQHSGLMILDFDKYPSIEVMNDSFEELKKNKHIAILFVSPSGNGLKAVLRVSDKLDRFSHPKVFKEFNRVFKYPYFDNANSNIDRVCFESYDPNIYFNPDAEIFEPEIKEEGFDIKERVPIIPIDDEDKIINFIMQWNWSKDFVEGERNNFIFDIAGAFCEFGINESKSESYILNNVIRGEFSLSEAKNTIKSAYKKRQFGIKYFEDYDKIDAIKVDLKNGKDKVLEKHKISESVYNEIKEVAEQDDFWFLNDKNKVQIDNLKYKLFLERNGFKKYFHNGSQKPTWIKIKENKVAETSTEKIKDFVLDYLLNRNEIKVWNYCSMYQNLFSENYLLMLQTIELLMLKDTKYKSFIAFQNGILEVTKNSIELIDYIDIDGYIFESQIITRQFEISEILQNQYQHFIGNISAQEPKAIECTIGYLLNTYKNKMNNKAVILNDEVISDNPEGGTGKGLFVQGLRQIRKVAILDGKTFDDKKSFPYQTVSTETQIMVFDDIKKNWDFESKFSLVTEGITLERKNKDAIKLPVEDSPKILITTNYAVKGEGNSHDRRRHEIEIAQYYGKDLTPFDEFGEQLFDDWEDDQWQKFDNYMIHCIQKYLKYGLIEQTSAKNIKLRKFIAETSSDFYEWVEDRDNFSLNIRYEKRILFEHFTSEYKDFSNKYFKQKSFSIWMKKYASYKDFKYLEGNTNSQRWLEISNGEPAKEEDPLAF